MIKTCIALCAACASMSICAHARAGTYVVRSCTDSPSGPAHSLGWSRAPQTTDAGAVITLSCAAGGPAFAASAVAAHPRGAELGIQWAAAPNTSVVGASWNQSVFVPGAAPSWAWALKVDGIDANTGERFGFAQCFDSSTGCAQWTKYDGESVNATGGRKASRMLVLAECDNYWPNSCPASPIPRASIAQVSLIIEDLVPPRFSTVPTGTLLTSTPISGVASVAFAATDKGGGLREARIEIDGVVAARTSLDDGDKRCTTPFVRPAPCPLATNRVLTLDTSTVADGTHKVALSVVDATGSNKVTYGPWTVTTRNGHSSNDTAASAVPACEQRSRGFSRWSVSSAVVRRDQPVTVLGRLTRKLRSRAHDVVLFSRTPQVVHDTVQPDARGVFKARVRISASQRLRAAVRTADATVIGCSPGARVQVRAETSISASQRRLRNGNSLALTGEVRAGGRSVGSAIVRLMVRAASSNKWFSAGEVSAGADGRWQWRHRFTQTRQRTKYVFRAVVPRQRGHSFAKGRSRSVQVLVLP